MGRGKELRLGDIARPIGPRKHKAFRTTRKRLIQIKQRVGQWRDKVRDTFLDSIKRGSAVFFGAGLSAQALAQGAMAGGKPILGLSLAGASGLLMGEGLATHRRGSRKEESYGVESFALTDKGMQEQKENPDTTLKELQYHEGNIQRYMRQLKDTASRAETRSEELSIAELVERDEREKMIESYERELEENREQQKLLADKEEGHEVESFALTNKGMKEQKEQAAQLAKIKAIDFEAEDDFVQVGDAYIGPSVRGGYVVRPDEDYLEYFVDSQDSLDEFLTGPGNRNAATPEGALRAAQEINGVIESYDTAEGLTDHIRALGDKRDSFNKGPIIVYKNTNEEYELWSDDAPEAKIRQTGGSFSIEPYTATTAEEAAQKMLEMEEAFSKAAGEVRKHRPKAT